MFSLQEGMSLMFQDDQLIKTSGAVESLLPDSCGSDSSMCTSIKLLNCFGDWKIFSKSFVVLRKLDCERYFLTANSC